MVFRRARPEFTGSERGALLSRRGAERTSGGTFDRALRSPVMLAERAGSSFPGAGVSIGEPVSERTASLSRRTVRGRNTVQVGLFVRTCDVAKSGWVSSQLPVGQRRRGGVYLGLSVISHASSQRAALTGERIAFRRREYVARSRVAPSRVAGWCPAVRLCPRTCESQLGRVKIVESTRSSFFRQAAIASPRDASSRAASSRSAALTAAT